jgi:PleD family two-component response regulator
MREPSFRWRQLIMRPPMQGHLSNLGRSRQIQRTNVNLLVLVVDDEPDVEALFRQHFRRDLRVGRFTMEFAYSATAAINRIENAAEVSLILILSDINMPGMSGLELLPLAKALHHDHRLWRCGDETQGAGEWRRGTSDKTHRLCNAA